MAELRALQHAPGHEFSNAYPASDLVSARFGTYGASARIDFGDGRVRLSLAGGDASDVGSFGLQTVHVGRFPSLPDAARTLPPLLATRVEGQEAVLSRDGVEERYLAGPLGLEQSYWIESRPEGSGPLTIEVAFEALAPVLAADATDVVLLVDDQGGAHAVYRDVLAVDAEGRELTAWMEVAGGSVTLLIQDAGAVYPVVVDPLIVTQQAKLTANDGAPYDFFGVSVSQSGETAVVGAYQWENWVIADRGAAYVFVRDGTNWSEEAMLTASDFAESDFFGLSVSVSGDTAVVGAFGDDVGGNRDQGSAYVFVRSGLSWSEEAKLTASDGARDDSFGFAVSVSGDTAVIGARGATVGGTAHQGAAYVFTRSGGVWSEEAKLTASDGAEWDSLGVAVSVSGDTAFIGAPAATIGANTLQGAAYVFVRSGGSWSEEAKLTASDGGMDDYLGLSLSVLDGTAIIGAPNARIGATAGQGAAYVFVRNAAGWTEEAKLTASDGALNDWFGAAVGVSGGTALVGTSFATGYGRQSAAYVFVRSGVTWSEGARLTASDGVADDAFGHAVSLSGSTAMVGAEASQGAAYVFLLERSLGDLCEAGPECASGFCADGVCCDAACGTGPCDACSLVAGAPSDGACVLLTGTSCEDGDACTRTGSCLEGVCVGGPPVTCSPSDDCHDTGACVPATGFCTNPTKADGTRCSDGDACTQTDTCQQGECAGSSPIVCTPLDACHDAVCDPATGACSEPLEPDGTSCDDQDACTRTDSCQAGACAGLEPVVCTTEDQCHEAGSCDPTTGECSNPPEPDGTACSDGDACTGIDTCNAGECTGHTPVACSPSNVCHDAGSCDPATGACSDPVSPDGSTCDDGDGCTTTDVCTSGECLGTPVVCDPPDECHDAGSCVAWTGTCLNPAKPDGSSCTAGSCVDGVCTEVPEPNPPDSSPGDGAAAEEGCGCSAGETNRGGVVASWLLGVSCVRALRRRRSAPRRAPRSRAPPARLRRVARRGDGPRRFR